jgi:uncharacterized protein (TIGR03437 family)
VRAPLLTTSSGQIGIQIPGDLPAGSANVVVSVAGEMSNTVTAALPAAAPVILAVTHGSTGTLVSAASPVTPGEVLVLYMNGLGAVNQDLAFGAAAPQEPLLSTVVPPQVTLGNTALDVMFSGLTPGFVGLYQVNASVPANLPPGMSALLAVTSSSQTTTMPLAVSTVMEQLGM